ncbi:MAG: hypothetical protein OEY23_25205, partial [Acidimicrobiia bacterium]|nr:hypothetical protein [Acidimicrobiia bacterium]
SDADAPQLRLFAQTSETFVVRSLGKRLGELDLNELGDRLLRAVTAGAPDGAAELGDRIAIVVADEPARRLDVAMAAVDGVLAAGRSVLVLSASNRMLDDAARQLVEQRQLVEPGVALRVGLSGDRSVGEHPALSVEVAAARRRPDLSASLADAVTERAALERRGQLAASPKPAPPIEPLGAAESPPSAPGTGSRLAAETARRDLAEIEGRLAVADAQTQRAAAAHSRARQRVRTMEECHAAFARLDDAALALEETERDTHASAAGLRRLAADNPGGEQLRASHELAVRRLTARDDALARYRHARREVEALAHSRADLGDADRRLEQARSAHAASERAALALRAQQAKASAALRGLGGPQPATPAPVSPGTTELPGAPHDPSGPEPAADTARRRELQAAHDEIRSQLRVAGGDAIREVPLVLTTFAQLLANPSVYDRTFDNVVVIEAGGAPAAQLVLAALHAGTALTLVTASDERPEPIPWEAPPTRRRWFSESVLDLIAGPAAASGDRAPLPGILRLD